MGMGLDGGVPRDAVIAMGMGLAGGVPTVGPFCSRFVAYSSGVSAPIQMSRRKLFRRCWYFRCSLRFHVCLLHWFGELSAPAPLVSVPMVVASIVTVCDFDCCTHFVSLKGP